MQKEVREGSSVSSRNSDESSQNSSYAEDDPQKGTLGQTEPKTRRKKKNPKREGVVANNKTCGNEACCAIF